MSEPILLDDTGSGKIVVYPEQLRELDDQGLFTDIYTKDRFGYFKYRKILREYTEYISRSE